MKRYIENEKWLIQLHFQDIMNIYLEFYNWEWVYIWNLYKIEYILEITESFEYIFEIFPKLIYILNNNKFKF